MKSISNRHSNQLSHRESISEILKDLMFHLVSFGAYPYSGIISIVVNYSVKNNS